MGWENPILVGTQVQGSTFNYSFRKSTNQKLIPWPYGSPLIPVTGGSDKRRLTNNFKDVKVSVYLFHVCLGFKKHWAFVYLFR